MILNLLIFLEYLEPKQSIMGYRLGSPALNDIYEARYAHMSL